MASQSHASRPGYWGCCWRCGLTCGLFGVFTGPLAMLGAMSLENYLHGTVFLGLELIGAPFMGALLGVVEGAALGLGWAHFNATDRRLTIAHLMLLVAIAGPALAIFVASPVLGSFIGMNGILLLPFAAMVLYGLCTATSSDDHGRMPEEAESPSMLGWDEPQG